MFVLEFLVLLKEEFVKRLGEHIIYLSCQLNLSHLQLNQVVLDHRVLEVGVHHLLQESHVLSRELAQTLIESPGDLRVSLDFPTLHVVDVIFAVIQIIDERFEIFEHQLSVGQNLLVFDEVSNRLLVDLPLGISDQISIIVLLTVEKHVQT